jgi:hypothetical protein
MSRRLVAAAFACALALPGPAAGQARYGLVITGASGGERYAEDHAKWRAALAETLLGRMAMPEANLRVLSETGDGGARATRENVRQALTELAGSVRRTDLLLVILIGHGTFDGVDAKFNLVGPDLEAEEWKTLLAGIGGRIVFVNTTGASFPFLQRLSGENRILIAATDTAAQSFSTVFPEYFSQSFMDAGADLDKNTRVSVLEAFTYASTRVRQHYEQRGQLATERPVIDDNGDGIGKEAGQPGPDGALAARTYLDPSDTLALPADPELGELVRRRAALEEQVEELKARKPMLQPGEYEKELERLLIELARVSREIRRRS